MRRALSVRDTLALLVLGCILPISGVATYLLFDYYAREETRLIADASGRTGALSAAVDHEFASIEASLLALATSTRLRNGDFEGFRTRLVDALRNMHADGIALTDPDGRLLMSTAVSYSGGTPDYDLAVATKPIAEHRKPAVSDLFSVASMGGWVYAVGVPVETAGTLIGTLHAIVRPPHLVHLLTEHRLPPTWRLAILDRDGRIAARSHEMERLAGTQVSPSVLKRIHERDHDAFSDRSLDGIEVNVVYTRSPTTGWTVAVGIPSDEMKSEMRDWLSWLVFFVCAALLGGLLLAWYVGGRIARSIRALAEPARQLGEGGTVAMPRVHFQEAIELGNALVHAGVALGQARHDAHHDPLTGLANRALLNEVIERQIAACQRYHRELSVLFIDLDGFKTINDTHGHALGDQLLRAVSARIVSSIRAADIAARLGGDEFAICLLETGLPGATHMAQKLIGVLSRPFVVSDIEARISASIGAAAFPTSATDADTLLKSADRAMYRAKSQGKNRVCTASDH